MGGCPIEDDQHYFPSALTLVLVGRTGNGKSATANSIIGSNEFVSKRKSGGVTITSELKTTKLEDGRMINVIDTLGLFDSSADSKFIGKEIVSCLNMARDGIHGVLVVFSVFGRFTEEETAVLSCLVTLFGTKIYEYVIIVFTGGDELEEVEKSLKDFLSDSPEALKKQNMEFEELVEKQQSVNLTKQLINLEMLVLIEQLRDKQFERIMKLYESKVMEIKVTLEKRLEEERAKREKAEDDNKEQQKKFEDEINKLKKEL